MAISVISETLHLALRSLQLSWGKKTTIPVDEQYSMLITVAAGWICAFKAN